MTVLDWSCTGKNFLSLFDSEEVTKNEKMIHAWPGKLSEYLKAIRDSL